LRRLHRRQTSPVERLQLRQQLLLSVLDLVGPPLALQRLESREVALERLDAVLHFPGHTHSTHGGGSGSGSGSRTCSRRRSLGLTAQPRCTGQPERSSRCAPGAVHTNRWEPVYTIAALCLSQLSIFRSQRAGSAASSSSSSSSTGTPRTTASEAAWRLPAARVATPHQSSIHFISLNSDLTERLSAVPRLPTLRLTTHCEHCGKKPDRALPQCSILQRLERV
jgi:hypothetical protein